jgi:hypothetical protein
VDRRRTADDPDSVTSDQASAGGTSAFQIRPPTTVVRQVLTAATRVEVDGDTLTLLDAKNAGIATYERLKLPTP